MVHYLRIVAELMDKQGNLGVEYESLCAATSVADTIDIDAVDDGC
jgi:hypothetical protein